MTQARAEARGRPFHECTPMKGSRHSFLMTQTNYTSFTAVLHIIKAHFLQSSAICCGDAELIPKRKKYILHSKALIWW